MAKKKQTVTNAMRILDKQGIQYETIEYDAGGEVGEHFGERIAELCGIAPETSFKTLVVRGKELYVCCIPVCDELDLKKLASKTGEKKVEMIHVRELLGLTGYIRGGVSPIGMKKKYRTFIDQSVKMHEKVAVSGGVCGLTLIMTPDDMLKATDAEACDITKKEN
ncbi:MAG: Cys-tRNA(Pro) deacylase [Clostridia bacterium]|nr:Cys-tRNA(Pro) deacylase [Clostridia bacterium]